MQTNKRCTTSREDLYKPGKEVGGGRRERERETRKRDRSEGTRMSEKYKGKERKRDKQLDLEN